MFPDSWGERIVCPVYKAGPQNDPNNYRGISITTTTTMYTIVSNNINQRLYRYSATDNVFCLQAMSEQYLGRQGGRFYCLHVDLRGAFDKIDHHKLFESLQNKGVNGNFVKVIVKRYANPKSCVKISSNCATSYFPCNIGTRQGDISSPTIVSLFIDQLANLLRQNCETGIFIDNSIPDMLCLMFADDVANCAETVNRLQPQLNIVGQFCISTGMEVDLSKTQNIVIVQV